MDWLKKKIGNFVHWVKGKFVKEPVKTVVKPPVKTGKRKGK